MHQSFKKKILAFLEKEKISMAALERQAGLKVNTLRNVMYDKSKNPSLETILKLSNALEVSIDYLLRPNIEEIALHEDLFLSKEVFDYVTNWIISHKPRMSMKKFFPVCEEIYEYSKKTGNNKLDKTFANFQLEKL